jgi:hypothetical protein
MGMTQLQDTAWLARRLNLSESTIERLRAKGGSELPPHLSIGHSIRYDVDVVDFWCKQRLQVAPQISGDVQ